MILGKAHEFYTVGSSGLEGSLGGFAQVDPSSLKQNGPSQVGSSKLEGWLERSNLWKGSVRAYNSSFKRSGFWEG